LKKIFDKLYIASDHAGFDLKNKIILYFKKKKILILDFGPFLKKSVDYPDFAKKVSTKVKQKKTNLGILVCGSGTGMAISANKLKGIRAAVCYNAKSTRLSRQHNNANIIALGSRLTNKKEVFKLIQIFIKTQFEGGRHLRRVKKI
jgi:ribose 5-phosphate isomerase B